VRMDAYYLQSNAQKLQVAIQSGKLVEQTKANALCADEAAQRIAYVRCLSLSVSRERFVGCG
jgi:hypothetical protein